MTMPELWGDLFTTAGSISTPIAFLQEAGSKLGRSTGDVVFGIVDNDSGKSGDVNARVFKIICPALNNFTFTVLSFQPAAPPFPVTVSAPAYLAGSGSAEAKNEQEFGRIADRILNSEGLRVELARILSQATKGGR